MESVVSDASFWRGRRVLVTGHTGFKGGWLTLWLRSLGAEVTGLALQPEVQSPLRPSFFSEVALARDCDSHIVDVRDARAVASVVGAARPEIVFHLAAQPLVRASYDDASATWMTNVMGTIGLLDALREAKGARAIVVITSDKCYEQGAGARAFREGDALGGHDPYSSSKAAAEIATASWRRSFFDAEGVGVATARAGNVIGGGDWAADRLIPDLVRGAMKGLSVPIRYPRATRPWQHVLDPLRGYLMLAERLAHEPGRYAGAWNFGPGAKGSLPVADVAERFSKALDRGARWHVAEDASLHEAATLALDVAKAREELGWRPHWAIGEAILRTADAYRVSLDGGDLRSAMLEQIAAHDASLEAEAA